MHRPFPARRFQNVIASREIVASLRPLKSERSDFGGQKPVGKALRKAFADCLSSVAVEFKTDVRYMKYRLCQIADMFCGFALLDYKFSNGLQTDIDEMFADDHKNLRKRFLKKVGRLDVDRCGFR